MTADKRNGIRLDPSMEWKCLACGGTAETTDGKYSWRTCTKCNKSYYRNHCWNCKTVVDSRDTENVKCPTCGWLKCTCSACHLGGCTTNPYRNEVPLEDIAEMEEIMHQLAIEVAEEEAERQEMMRQAAIEAAEEEAEREACMRQAAIEAAEEEAEREEMMRQAAIEAAEEDAERDFW